MSVTSLAAAADAVAPWYASVLALLSFAVLIVLGLGRRPASDTPADGVGIGQPTPVTAEDSLQDQVGSS